MTTLTAISRKALLMLACSLAWLTGQISALELSDIHFPLTRDEADQTLSKDYSYALLADGSVRRTWELDNKQVFIDFDTNTNEALLIAVVYTKPVPTKEGIEDAHTLGNGKYSANAKWDAPKDKASKELISDTFGLKNAKRKKLDDKAMLFYETNGKTGKSTRIERVSLFSHLPKTNRWVLDPISPGDKKTAMGNSWGDSFVEDIYKDEARRKEIPLRTPADTAAAADSTTSATGDSTATDKPASTGTMKVTITRHRTGMGTRTDVKVTSDDSSTSTPDSSTSTTSDTTPATPATGIRKIHGGQEAKRETISTLPPAPDFLKQFGVENPEWWHYIALGLIGLFVLGLIIRSIARASERASRQKKFAEVVGGTRKPRR